MSRKKGRTFNKTRNKGHRNRKHEYEIDDSFDYNSKHRGQNFFDEPSELQRNKSHKGFSQVVLEPRTENQKDFIDSLEDPDIYITAAIGPAGTGKTMLATLYAIKAFKEEKIEKIVITRPAVSVDEQHGFLPGNLNKKMEPWLLPIMDVFKKYYSQTQIRKMTNEGMLEIAPMAYMRGRTFDDAVIIADEMQNSTIDQCKMLLTRIGENSKIVMTGDPRQHDRGFDKNGLHDFAQKVEESDAWGIEIIEFENCDIQRHPVINQVLKLYDDDE